MHRRCLLGGLGLAATGLRTGIARASDPPHRPPNVLVIVCDDLGDGPDGLAGHPQALTPSIAQFFKSAIRFTNAHTAATLCAPSRAALWTGLAPTTSGLFEAAGPGDHWRRNPALRAAPTVFEHFRGHGYAVAATGKVFHNGQEDPLVWTRWGSVRGTGEFPTFGPWPWDGRSWVKRGFRRRIVPSPHSLQPATVGPWLSHARLSAVPTVKGHRGWFMDDGSRFHHTSPGDRDPLPDELSARWAADLLGRSHRRPFFITVGLNRPHAPFYAPDAFFEALDPQGLEPPPALQDDLDDVPRVSWPRRNRAGAMPASGLMAVMHRHGATYWRGWLHAFLANVAFVDAQIGQVLDALERGPNASDTLVLLTSDHGFHMGDKARIGKKSLWETATRVPFAIRIPGHSGRARTCNVPVSLLDVYPTLVALCGLPSAPNPALGNALELDGESLVPLLADPTGADWHGRQAALTAIQAASGGRQGAPGRTLDQHLSLRTERWRYTRYASGEEELYDHRSDPREWRNRARDRNLTPVLEGLRMWLAELTAARSGV